MDWEEEREDMENAYLLALGTKEMEEVLEDSLGFRNWGTIYLSVPGLMESTEVWFSG